MTKITTKVLKLIEKFDEKVKKGGFSDPEDDVGGCSWYAYDSEDYDKALEELKEEIKKQ